MTKRYTVADFANAKFAEHPNGGYAHRMPDGWVVGSRQRHSDEAMAHAGWVPVPTKPTITARELRNVNGVGYVSGFIDGFLRSGGEIIPDPEPTDEELLAGIIRNIDDWQSITSPELLAKYLNTAGVTAPKEDN